MTKYANWLIGASGVAIILAAIGAGGADIWLAATQWLIVAAVLAVYAIYAKINS